MLRDVFHLHIPALPVALARLADPALRGKPTVVSTGGPRGVVLCASAEARGEGIGKGMPLSQARRLCRRVAVAPPEPSRVLSAQGALAAVAGRYTPLLEPSRPGHFYLEMTGGRRLLGEPRDAASRLALEVASRLSLAASVGIGPNKLVAAIASKVLSADGVCDVVRGSEAAFLAPLPVSLLPGVGEKRLLLLRDWNVRSIGELASIRPARLEAVFGPGARILHERAAGIDPTPVKPPEERTGISESRTLDADECDDGLLIAHLFSLLEAACRALRLTARAARRIEVRLTHSDGREESSALLLPKPLFWDFELKPLVHKLFFRACRRRVRVRRIGLSLTGLAALSPQLELFGGDGGRERDKSLLLALDEIRRRHGFGSVGFAAALAPAP